MKTKYYRSVIAVLFLVILLSQPSLSFSALVELKNGKSIEGRLTAVNESTIVLSYNFGEIEFPIKRISHLRNLDHQEMQLLQKSEFIKKHYDLVKSVPFPKEENELTEESYDYSRKAAIEAMQTLKDKLEEKSVQEKNDIQMSYADQVNFLEKKIESLSQQIQEKENEQNVLLEKINLLERSGSASEEDLSAKRKQILSLQQDINEININAFKKEKEASERIRSVIIENEKLYAEEITSLKNKHASEKQILKNEITAIKDNLKNRETKLTETIASTMEKLEIQHAAEKEALQKHYEAQISGLREEQLALIKRSSIQMDNLKKELAGSQKKLLLVESQADEKISQALLQKEQYYEEQKATHANKFRNQMETLQKEISILTLHNDNLLQKDGRRQSEFLKISGEEKKRLDTIARLQKEVQALIKEKQDQALVLRKEYLKEKNSLKSIVSSSGDKLARFQTNSRILKENIDLLREEIKAMKVTNETLESKITLMDKEADAIRQEKNILAQRIEKAEVLRSAEKDEIIVGIVSEALQKDPASVTQDSLSSDVVKMSSARAALIELYKDDLMKMQDIIDAKDNELKKISSENLSIRSELSQAQSGRKTALSDLEKMQQSYVHLEKEKAEIKNNADLIIKQVQQQAKADVDREKENLRSSYNEVIANLEQRFAEVQVTAPVTVLQGIPVDAPLETVEIAEIAEEPAPVAAEIPGEKTAPQTVPETSSLVQAGTISDVGIDYGRIYIETLSSIDKGDILWVKKDDGKSYQFKVIQVLPNLKGAIAEISILDQIHDVQENDPVFSIEK